MKPRPLPASAPFALLSFSIFLATSAISCSPDEDPIPIPPPLGHTRALIAPSPEALTAAQSLQEIPGAEVRFSQVHGYPLEINALAPEVRPEEAKPLEISHGAFSSGRASALIKFISRHHTAFGLPDAESGTRSELKLSVDRANPELNENDQTPNPTGVHSTRVDQHIGGLRVVGRYALGHFDPRGNLFSAVTRLLPVDRAALRLNPAFGENDLARYVDPILNALSSQSDLRWLSGITFIGSLHSSELLLLPEAETPGARLTLAYLVRLRSGFREVVIYLDARTGAKLRAYDNLPSDWHDEASALISAMAPDETGAVRTIRACRRDSKLYMGFGSNYVSGTVRPFNSDQWLTVVDVADMPANWQTPFQQTIVSPTATAFDPARGFTGSKRQLTSANLTIQGILDWWATRGWRSWDGRGSSLSFLANSRPNADGTPSNGAWGGGGFIETGGFPWTTAGSTMASDIEVVGHEFMHSVIGATSGIEYWREAGALNEALADLFGVALTVDTATDRLADAKIGIVFNIRDMRDPRLSGQPDRYSGFIETDGDFGGVHTNSGIINHAHWLMIQGGTFNGITVRALGARKVLDLIRLSNRFARFAADTSLEEFASTIVGRCRITAVFGALFGVTTGLSVEDCSMVERAYRSVELLGFAPRPDLIVESSKVTGEYVNLSVRNGSAESFNLLEYTWELMDGDTVLDAKEIVSRAPLGTGTSMAAVYFDAPEINRQEGTLTWIVPGGSATIGARISQTVLGEGVLSAPRSLSVRLRRTVSGNDANTWNNQIPVRFSSEISGLAGMPEPRDGGQTSRLRVSHINVGMTLIAPVTSVLLSRNTENGPFEVIPGTEQTLTGVTRAQDASGSSGAITGRVYFPELILPGNLAWSAPPNVILSDIVYMGAPVVGYDRREVWFNATGGRPELAGQRQIYMLSDALDTVNEDDEGDNFVCLNCSATLVTNPRTAIVRFPRTARDLESLFPARYRAAAAKLRSLREGELREIIETVGHAGLGYRR